MSVMYKARLPKHKLPFWGKIILVLCGVIFSIAFLEISLRFGGFIFSSLQEYRNRAAVYKRGNYRIMCLGESTTAMGGSDSYPSQLEEILNQRNIGISFSVINKGVPMINTSYILEHLEENLDKYHPDMVIAMMGNNDSCVKYCQDIPESNTALFSKIKVYKFLRILWMNMQDKISRKASLVSQPDIKAEVTASLFQPKEVYTEKPNNNPDEGSLIRQREIHTGDDNTYVESEVLYIANERSTEKAEEYFQKAIELNPRNLKAHIELGNIYRNQLKFIKAEQAFRKAIEIAPKNEIAYLALARLYNVQGKVEDSNNILKKLIDTNPKNDRVYTGMGIVYMMAKEYTQAKDYFKKAAAFNPANHMAYYQSGEIYMYEQNFDAAEDMFKKAIPFDRLGKAHDSLILLYQIQGKSEAAQECAKKLKVLRQNNNNIMTQDNYLKLKKILDKRGIRLVCVQYPVLSVGPLRKIFEGEKRVIFVDNEQLFKDALKKGSFREYFIDMFAGEFGHCTRKGNWLLAENIAKAILEECLKR